MTVRVVREIDSRRPVSMVLPLRNSLSSRDSSAPSVMVLDGLDERSLAPADLVGAALAAAAATSPMQFRDATLLRDGTGRRNPS